MQPSARLYNEDLAPSTERKWGTFSIISVWFACLHNMATYTTVSGMFGSGLAPWEVAVGCLIGFCVIMVGVRLTGTAGQRYGISFPVLARASFGVFGANLPALIRAVVAVAWYGIQTYLASQAIIVLLISIDPGIRFLTQGGFLGLSPLGWICFLCLWGLQLFLVTHGMNTVRLFQNWAGPVLSGVMVMLAVALTIEAGGHLDFFFATKHIPVGSAINDMGSDAGLLVATWGTLMLNFCDFSRFSPTPKAVRRGTFWGIPVNGVAFLILVVVNTVAGYAVWGRLIEDPTTLLAATNNRPLIIIGALLFVFATIGVNVIANVVSPAYDFANVFPRKLDFRRGALLTSVLAVVVLPWNFYNSTVAVDYFLGGLGAFLGPLFGVIITDFVWNRRGRLTVDDLYSDDPQARYFYRHGVNPRALAAFIPAAIISAVLALVPVFSALSPYSWFIGVIVAGGLYRMIRPRQEVTTQEAEPSVGTAVA
jgi:NCS1 family nucleobase:cation symporter-1